MQQPRSIQRFDVFFLASLAAATVGFFVGYDDTLRELRRQLAGTGVEMGGGFITTTFIVTTGINLLLWWLVSAKRNVIAKWVLVVFFAFGLLGLPSIFRNLTLSTGLSLLSFVLAGVAIYFLFQPDTKPWFGEEEPR